MKKLLAFLLTASVSVCVFAADFNFFPALKGSVKNYTQTEYSVASKFGSYYRTPTKKVFHKFDSAGQEIESTNLTPKDVVVDKISFTYDNYGLLTEEKCSDVDGNIIWKNTSEYKNGKKISCSEFNAKDVLKIKSIYTYDGDKLVDESGYDGEGALIWKTIYSYCEKGLLSKVTQYSADGALSQEDFYTYNDAGDIESVQTFDNFTSTSYQSIYRYTNGVLTEITVYNQAQEVVKRIIYKNDGNGNPVKISEYNIAQKFGTTVNELISIKEFAYNY